MSLQSFRRCAAERGFSMMELMVSMGITMAGPNLTVQSWQKGLFSFPVTNKGLLTAAQFSFGNHGIWGFTDYTAYDDTCEIWWDPTAVGEDEVCNTAAGMRSRSAAAS